MRTAKLVGIVLVLAATASALTLWFKTFIVGAYYLHAGAFLSTLVALVPLAILWAAINLVKFIFKGDIA